MPITPLDYRSICTNLEDCSAGLVSRILLNWPNGEAEEPMVGVLRIHAPRVEGQAPTISR